MLSDEQYMRMAIEKARAGIEQGQMPFGAAIVNKNGEIIACEHNLVWRNTDITAHAEVTAIRKACGIVGGIDLSGHAIYSTTEPCPMCFSACHWARFDRIYYGASIADARAAGFSEMPISNQDMKRMGSAKVEIVPDLLKSEAAELFRVFAARGARRVY